MDLLSAIFRVDWDSRCPAARPIFFVRDLAGRDLGVWIGRLSAGQDAIVDEGLDCRLLELSSMGWQN